jgi:hypothetical protein
MPKLCLSFSWQHACLCLNLQKRIDISSPKTNRYADPPAPDAVCVCVCVCVWCGGGDGRAAWDCKSVGHNLLFCYVWIRNFGCIDCGLSYGFWLSPLSHPGSLPSHLSSVSYRTHSSMFPCLSHLDSWMPMKILSTQILPLGFYLVMTSCLPW